MSLSGSGMILVKFLSDLRQAHELVHLRRRRGSPPSSREESSGEGEVVHHRERSGFERKESLCS